MKLEIDRGTASSAWSESAVYLLAEAEDDVGVAALGEGVADGQVHPSHHPHLEQPEQALHRSISLPPSISLVTATSYQQLRAEEKLARPPADRRRTTGAAATPEVKLNPETTARHQARFGQRELGEGRPGCRGWTARAGRACPRMRTCWASLPNRTSLLRFYQVHPFPVANLSWQ